MLCSWWWLGEASRVGDRVSGLVSSGRYDSFESLTLPCFQWDGAVVEGVLGCANDVIG